MYTAKDYVTVSHLGEAMRLLKADPQNAIIAGGMMMRLGKAEYHTLIDLSGLGLDQVTMSGEHISIGAMATLRQVEQDPVLRSHGECVLPGSVSPIIGTQFRNMATIGASVYGRYAFSDPITALLALDAEVRFYEGGKMPLGTYLTGRPRRDILISIEIPLDDCRASYQTHRLTTTDFGVLDVCCARKTDGSYRLAIGSRPSVAARARNAENLLRDGDTEGALKSIRQELMYGSNLRGSAEYRKTLATVLTRRALSEISEGGASL